MLNSTSILSLSVLLIAALNNPSDALNIPHSVLETIDRGDIAVLPNFVSPSEVSRWRTDAINLHRDGEFIVDALAGYGKKKKDAKFDPAKDRAVLPAYIPSQKKAGPFVSASLGDASGRQALTQTIANLRHELAVGLQRPGVDALPDGPNNHEISFTRFGPGANLARHVDEHHEELKGRAGWAKPTRRSLSWLIYLNEDDWSADTDGGCLRTYERTTPSSNKVGSRNGDLQIAWLVPTPDDRKERPVFLDGRRNDGKCALYIDSDDGERRIYLTRDFDKDPYLFLSGDMFVQNLLIADKSLKRRFHYIEQPQSAASEFLLSKQDPGETVNDVPPIGGTLVLFDSVTLPHEVLPTTQRERWAASGWFHEAQQRPSNNPIIL
mmetsp:Transcript_16348/g.24741  ORF Transcript_16348/g.24741 Transcript_16348/m.24741 type:complete len:380 (+) Transcript_16348:59-1198(+)